MSIASPYQTYRTQTDLKALWLCIRMPILAMNSLRVRFKTQPHSEQANSAQAIAIVEQQRILQTNDVAKRLSIKTSHSVEHAQMIAPELKLLERDLAKEAQKLNSLSEWVYRFSSHVHVYNEQAILLEIGRSLELFKGLKHLQHLVSQGLDQMGVDACFGVAETPKAAHLLSFSPQATCGSSSAWRSELAKTAIENSNIKHLALDQKIIDKLHHCGLQRVKEVLAIPISELGARFGKELIHYLDLLQGNVADPLRLIKPAEDFIARIDFSEPISNKTWIEQQIRRLLKDLMAFIDSRNLVCRGFKWRLYSDKNQILKNIDIHLNSSQNDFDMLSTLTHLQFEKTEMQWEFSSIELASHHLYERHSQARDLFEVNHNEENLNQLLDKLASRLGSEALYKVQEAAEHLPELANLTCPVNHKRANPRAGMPLPADFKDEPLWLLEQPKKLMQQTGRPLRNGLLDLIHGPHRISSHWWSNLHSRDYYIARQAGSSLLWVYYDRKRHNWYLHGLFA